jgi:hypothetical protein
LTALRSAAKNKKVKAIILRVDSCGGSYVASDLIHREVPLLLLYYYYYYYIRIVVIHIILVACKVAVATL